MPTNTHLLSAANIKVGHVRGVQPVPLRLTGANAEDADAIEDAIRDTVRRVLPRAGDPLLRWRPSGLTVDVWIKLTIRTNGSSRVKVATFTVRPAAGGC